MMTTTKWKDIAEIIALFAVVASLIAVAFELRQTQLALRAEAYQARAFQAFDDHMLMAQTPELDRLFRQSLEEGFDIDDLPANERMQMERLYLAIRTDVDNEFYQYQIGLLDAGFYEKTTVGDIKLFAPVWRSLGIRESTQAFRDEVDRVLSDASIQPVDVPTQPDE